MRQEKTTKMVRCGDRAKSCTEFRSRRIVKMSALWFRETTPRVRGEHESARRCCLVLTLWPSIRPGSLCSRSRKIQGESKVGRDQIKIRPNEGSVDGDFRETKSVLRCLWRIGSQRGFDKRYGCGLHRSRSQGGQGARHPLQTMQSRHRTFTRRSKDIKGGGALFGDRR